MTPRLVQAPNPFDRLERASAPQYLVSVEQITPSWVRTIRRVDATHLLVTQWVTKLGTISRHSLAILTVYVEIESSLKTYRCPS